MNNSAEQTRVCKNCIEEKPLSLKFFPTAGRMNGTQYFRWKCIPCYSIQKNESRVLNVTKVHQHKNTLVCQACGFSDYRAPEFHHTNPKEKEYSIADMMRRGFGLDAIFIEMKKCTCLCVNCHKIVHYEEKI